MKKLATILHSLSYKKEFGNLKKHYYINKIKELLPPHLTHAISFMYTKQNTLFFAMNSQAKRAELEYKKEMILSWIQKIVLMYPSSSFLLQITDIKIFVIFKTMLQEQEIQETSKMIYEERSDGDFNIDIDNPILQSLFEDIKANIKSNK